MKNYNIKANRLECENNGITSLFSEDQKELKREKNIDTQLTEGNIKHCLALESIQFRKESIRGGANLLKELLYTSFWRILPNGKDQECSSFAHVGNEYLKTCDRILQKEHNALDL